MDSIKDQDIKDVFNPHYLDGVMMYANAVGPPIDFFTSPQMSFDDAKRIINDAHSKSFATHPWQLRAESKYVSAIFDGNSTAETSYLVCR